MREINKYLINKNSSNKRKIYYTSLAIATALMMIQGGQTVKADSLIEPESNEPKTTSVQSSDASQINKTETSTAQSKGSIPDDSANKLQASEQSTELAQNNQQGSDDVSGSISSSTQQQIQSSVTSTQNVSNSTTDASSNVKSSNGISDGIDSTSGSLSIDQQQQNFLNTIKPLSIEGWEDYKILPSVTAAQAIVESKYGLSTPLNDPYNIFGIKGPGTYSETQEEGANGYYTIDASFQDYPTLEAAFQYHGLLLDGQEGVNYPGVEGNTNYVSATDALQNDGYATADDYASVLQNVIQSLDLTEWDEEAFEKYDYPKAPQDTSVITIEYAPGYGVNAYDNTGVDVPGSNEVFLDGTEWRTAGTKVIDGQEMYEVSSNEYIPAKYTNAYDNGIITINYAPGYGVNAYDRNGTEVPNSNQTFITGSSWKVDGVVNLNGQIMYYVGNDEFIPKSDTQFGGMVTVHYVPGYGINAYASDGSEIDGSNAVFLDGTEWKATKPEQINGELMYEVSTNEFIPAKYTQTDD